MGYKFRTAAFLDDKIGVGIGISSTLGLVWLVVSILEEN